MFIKEIELKNFKCFEHNTFTFEKNFTAIIGNNGSGKTALLDGIGTGLRSWLTDIVERYQFEIHQEHIRFETVKNGSKKQIVQRFPSKIKLDLKPFFERSKIFSMSDTILLETNNNSSKIIEPDKIVTLKKGLENENKKELPVIAFYQTSRLFQLKKENNKGLDLYPIDTRFKPYQDCLNISVNNNQVFEWIKRMTFIQLQEEEVVPELEAVKSSLIQSLQYLNPKKKIDLFFDVRSDELIINISGEYFPFNALSDGYRNTLGMIADIAYRMAELNPHLTTKSSGIVLIDELDLHLHPKWQRHIVNDLKTIFPNCQFIVTTHSPFIIQSLESGELLKLDETPEIEHDHFNKKGIEDIAEEFQDVEMPQRSIKFQEMLKVAEEYFNLIEKGATNGKLEPLRKRLTELEEIYSEEPAFVALLKAERKSQNI